MVVHDLLDLEGDGGRALIQDSVLSEVDTVPPQGDAGRTHLGRVVEEPGHGDALLVAAGERVAPLPRLVPAALALDDALDLHDLEDAKQVIVGDATCALRGPQVRNTDRDRSARSIICCLLSG
jgi:hypothetical protein